MNDILEQIDSYMVNDIAYMGNVGFAEMVTFFRNASSNEIKIMEKIIKRGDWPAFNKLIKEITGVELK